MLLHSLLALIAFDPIVEFNEVRDALDTKIPGYVWDLREIGDGNINYIYLADGKDQKVLIKKALDYARINPEAFPLPMDRLFFEYKAYTLYQNTCPERIPQIYFYDKGRGCLAMEYLTPHLILRKGLLAGKKYPMLSEHLGTFLGRSLYLTSRYHLSEEEWRENVATFSKNTSMRKIIEDLVYTDPFYGSVLNHWTSPELDDLVHEIQQDLAIKENVDLLKRKFLSEPEALAHGDLHTGSILVTESDTRVFDTEFAIYAPISFDIGMLLSNFTIASLASSAHGLDAQWISSQLRQTWEIFERTFRNLWEEQMISVDDKLQEIWSDTVKLMGVEIIRRTIGIAHNADFETISNREVKAAIERKALKLAKEFLLEAERSFPNIDSLEERIRRIHKHPEESVFDGVGSH
jgi:5-methylthioribose kinase